MPTPTRPGDYHGSYSGPYATPAATPAPTGTTTGGRFPGTVPGNGVPAPGTATTAPLAANATQRGAQAVIQESLDGYGLGSLGAWAWQRYLELGEGSEGQIMLEIRQRPEYQQRFPAMGELARRGRAIPEAEYISYEKDVRAIVQAYGLPKGVWDTPDAIAKGLLNDVSVAEVKDRADIASASSLTAPPEVRQYLREQYGLAAGDMTAFWLNPDNALPVIQKQYAAAQVGAEAAVRGLGTLSRAAAERLVEGGVGAEQARQGFGSVSRELTVGLPGEGEGLGVDNVALGAAGIGPAADALRRKRATRSAAFGGGGGFAATGEGVTGLGTASR